MTDRREYTNSFTSIVSSNFGARRRALGLSQEYVARSLNCHRSVVSKFEHGKASLPLEQAPLLQEVLRLKSIDELFQPGRFID